MTAAVLALGLIASGGAARALDRDKVRAAVPLPGMEFRALFSSGAPLDERPLNARIVALEAAPPTSDGLILLGEFYLEAKDPARSKAAFARAVAALRTEIKAHPDDSAAIQAGFLVRLSMTLRSAMQLERAEEQAQLASGIAPEMWKTWTELGEVQLQQAAHAVLPSPHRFGFKFGDASANYLGLSPDALGGRPNPEAIAKAQRLLGAAHANYVRALKLAPLDPEIPSKRVSFRSGETFLDGVLQHLNANETATLQSAIDAGAPAATMAMFSPASLADMQTVARLKPRDASASGMAAFAAISSHLMLSKPEFPLKDGLESLPAPVIAAVRENMERLEILARGDAKDQAAALEAQSVIAFMLGDSTALDKARRALTLDPTREQARELLIGVLSTENGFEEMATLIQAQLARQNSARYRLLLAKTMDKLGRAAEVETQVKAALQLEPGDLTANLARAALDLRAGDAARAGESLARTARLLLPAAKPSAQQKTEYAVLQAAFLALEGQPDAAKIALQSLLTADPKNKSAQQLLDALGT